MIRPRLLFPSLAWVMPVVLVAASAAAPSAGTETTTPAAVSSAEQALFMSNHLAGLRPPATLNYRFTKNGRLEPAFADTVSLALRALADGRCCTVRPEFFSGARRLVLPEVDALGDGNPVLMYFLEREVREMSRLTRGQPRHFRQRIRLALAETTVLRDVEVSFQGRTLRGREITIAPYLDDPMRPRFEPLAGKRYRFTLSDAVPGGIAALRAEVIEKSGEPLLVEELVLDGASVKR
jgi:hypothetical protein